jgi:hypothetical protein
MDRVSRLVLNISEINTLRDEIASAIADSEARRHLVHANVFSTIEQPPELQLFFDRFTTKSGKVIEVRNHLIQKYKIIKSITIKYSMDMQCWVLKLHL